MRVLVFQHTPGEHPAAFADHANAAGDEMVIIHLYKGDAIPPMYGFDALLVMGGPMDVWETDENPWLIPEKAAIADWLRTGRPFLGVCLGHQLMIEALGGKCAKLPTPEISVSDITRTGPDPIFDRLPKTFPVLKWNGVAAETLPDGVTVLASSPSCEVQAIRYGKCAWGVQFHPEITSELIADWMKDPANKECALNWLGSAQAAEAFASDAKNHADDAAVQSKALYAGLRQAAGAKA